MQAPLWSDYPKCPVCERVFSIERPPTSLLCGHSLCVPCTTHLRRGVCPFDGIPLDSSGFRFPVNLALLKLVTRESDSRVARDAPEADENRSETSSSTASSLAKVQLKQSEELGECVQDPECLSTYEEACKQLDAVTEYLLPVSEAGSQSALSVTGGKGPRLTRPLHKKLASLVQCQILHESGRSRLMRYARSVGERACTEMLLLHQNQASLVHDLWSAVKQRGGQFLGHVLQEQVLMAVYTVMSPTPRQSFQRKTLVEYVVHWLSTKYPTVSKTNVGHVIHLMYRASCFQVCIQSCLHVLCLCMCIDTVSGTIM